jgi:tRNA1(Val) A37 N6-methylase TrmN6
MRADYELTADRFLGGRLSIWQPRDGYRAAMDPVLLAAAVPAQAGDRILELGCGVGVASLCLGTRVPGLILTGLELQPEYAELARRNANENAVPLTVMTGDLARPPAALRQQHFDYVLANPPYFPAGQGTAARNSGRETAQREDTPLSVWVDAALRRLRPDGAALFIQSVDRLPDLLAAIGTRAGDIAVLPIAARINRPANRVILRARKGRGGGFALLPPVILHSGDRHLADGDDQTDLARGVLRNAQALSF